MLLIGWVAKRPCTFCGCFSWAYVFSEKIFLQDGVSNTAQSIFAESFAKDWQHWLVAKLFSGMGVGMLQSTMPVYLSEIAPTQLKGFLINAYTL